MASEKARCTECGEIAVLNRFGVCEYRGACEHRILRHEAEMARLNAALAANDPLPCGHTRSEHVDMIRGELGDEAARWLSDAMDDFLRQMREGYGPDV